MSPAEFRKTYSWHAALDLGPELVTLAEELPAHEQTGLVMQISELMIELPAMVAADLVDGSTLRFGPFYRLTATLELIERVYPALDAGAAKSALEELGSRLASTLFTEQVPAPAIVLPATLDQDDDEADAETAAADPAATALVPEPTPVPPAEPSAIPQTEQVNSVHVQPDSL